MTVHMLIVLVGVLVVVGVITLLVRAVGASRRRLDRIDERLTALERTLGERGTR